MKTEVAHEPSRSVGQTWRDDLDLPVAAAAAGGAVVIWLVAHVAGVELDVRSGGGTQSVGIFAVAIVPVVATLAAGALLRGMVRRVPRARRRWTGLSVTVLVLSLLGPVSAVTVRAGLVLAAMHVLVGAVIVAGLIRKDR